MHSPGTLQENTCSENDSLFPFKRAAYEPAPSPALPSTPHKPHAKASHRPTAPSSRVVTPDGSRTSSERCKGQTGFWVFSNLGVSFSYVMLNSLATQQALAVASTVSESGTASVQDTSLEKA